MAMWQCRTCRTGFDDTLTALDHRLRNQRADIWPVYSDG